MISRSILASLTITTLLQFGDCAAAQPIEVRDGSTNSARISSTQPNRLYIKGGRVHKIWGVEGRLVVKPDTDKGQFYFYPTETFRDKPFTMYVKDEEGAVYTLVLTPSDIPPETIALHREGKDSPKYKRQATAWEEGQPYEKTVTEFIKSMALDALPEGYTVKRIQKEIKLWNEADLRLELRYEGANLVGEVYILTNVDGKLMRIDEREFYRNGVLAVAIAKHELQPGEMTAIYLVTGAE